VENKTVDFDFKLKAGKLKNRNAIKILEINDYPEQIITEAIELSKELDRIYVVGPDTIAP
jgi:DNA mismatch repair ATPase MutS